jgi:hypothetical protein
MAESLEAGPKRSTGGRRKWIICGSVLLVLAAAGVYGVSLLMQKKEVDMDAVFSANNRGVGLMDKMSVIRGGEAIQAFEKVVEMAPDWLPGKINLGIALLNDTGERAAKSRLRARQIFGEVLEKDPDNPYAHFCLGIIMYDGGKLNERDAVVAHFERVTQIDPDNAAGWYWLGKSLFNDRKRAKECFQKALKLNPHLIAAYHNLQGHLDRAGADAAMREVLALKETGKETEPFGNQIGIKYSEQGRYAEVIGHRAFASLKPRVGPLPAFQRAEKLQVQLAKDVRWANCADFSDDVVGRLRARVRERFGAVMVVLDYDGDGKPDLFLVGAVFDSKSKTVRDLLLHNDGGGKFTDVTAAAGLASPRPSLGCCVADYDNDGKPDLLITGAGEQHLFRNTGKGGFEDVSAKAELDQLKTICLGAAFVDLDQDGDLDLIVAQYTSMDEADKAVRGNSAPMGKGLAVFLNIGEALPVPTQFDSPPLATRFRRVLSARDPDIKSPEPLLGPAVPTVNLAASDLDQDNDLDLIIVADNQPAELVVNDRLLRFHRVALSEALVPKHSWNGALVLDADRDERSDLLLVGPTRAPLLLLNQPPPGALKTSATWFKVGAVKSPPLLQALAVDLDLDGWTDVVGLSSNHIPVLLHNQGGKLSHVPEALGSDRTWPRDLVALTVADFTGDGIPDLMVWSESRGLELHVSQGNRNRSLLLRLTGQRCLSKEGNRKMRCPADAFGVRVLAQTKDHWTAAEYTTLSAGLGQSHQPLVLGMARHPEAEIVHLRWMDGTMQAEMNLPTNQVNTIFQMNRKGISCPVLFSWNGERYVFVTDFLGAGSLGEPLPDGDHRMPRPEESVKIEAEQLRPKDGQYVLKIAEPMDEVTYLDRLQLVAIDHPDGVAVYPDERFLDAKTPPSQKLLAFDRKRRIFPEKATDHRGRDVTNTLLRRDRRTVDGFAQRSWIGLAEEHWVTLDFGDRLEKVGPKERLFLCLAGWTDYPYPESLWAARQAGVDVVPPILERLRENGTEWEPVVTAAGQPVDAGFPAGLPRMMTLEVTGLVGKHSRKPLCGPRCILRLRTNMEVYWDQIFLAPLQNVVAEDRGSRMEDRGPRATCLEVSQAELSARGLMQEFSPDGKAPTLYDYDRVERVPVSRLSGHMTRYGQVTELLRAVDDRFVIFGPGDVLTVNFDAGRLPPLPSGWKRSFVLRTWGYCKDCAPFTATGETVEPLPFRAMTTYPYGPNEHNARDPRREDYRRTYNTRQVGPRSAATRRD